MSEDAKIDDQKGGGERDTRALRVRFALGFVVIAGVLFGFYTFPYGESGISEQWFTTYLSGYARIAGSVLSLFEPGLIVQGQDIVGRTSLRIVKNCDAMEAEILFAAAVLAFPSPWFCRILGALAGMILIAAVNVFRIGSLYYVGIYFPKAFEFVHLQVWPLLLIAAAVTAFLVWAGWARSVPRDAHAAA